MKWYLLLIPKDQFLLIVDRFYEQPFRNLRYTTAQRLIPIVSLVTISMMYKY
ncbi:MAG: hypothetical protein IKM10_07835 [Bacteroidaceae bacterium]|nr:hypothetical protein [Bacteroidaceae bacterium]